MDGDDIVGKNGSDEEVLRMSVNELTGAVTLDQSLAVVHFFSF